MSGVTLKVLDNDELARLVQARFPSLCRVVLKPAATYACLGLAGSAKDLIRSGFCNSKMIAQLPQCGIKRYGDTTIKRLRTGFRIERLYDWASIDRDKITAALGLPPNSLVRADRKPAVRLLPGLAGALAKRYPGLAIEATQSSCDEWCRQALFFNGSPTDIVKSGLLTADLLARSREQGTYTEYGDAYFVSEIGDGTCRVGIFTDHDQADADGDRRSNTKKLQVYVNRLLRPFARCTRAPPAKP